MVEITFNVISEIQPKQRPRARVVNGKFAQVYTPKTTAVYENLIKTTYQNIKGPYFDDKPLHIEIYACFAPSEEVKKLIAQGLVPACTIHKDLDNIAKVVLDALNGIAYKDDKQVETLTITKRYSTTSQSSIVVTIKEAYLPDIKTIKRYYKIQKLESQRTELKAKEKLNKAQTERLEKITKELKELCLAEGKA